MADVPLADLVGWLLASAVSPYLATPIASALQLAQLGTLPAATAVVIYTAAACERITRSRTFQTIRLHTPIRAELTFDGIGIMLSWASCSQHLFRTPVNTA